MTPRGSRVSSANSDFGNEIGKKNHCADGIVASWLGANAERGDVLGERRGARDLVGFRGIEREDLNQVGRVALEVRERMDHDFLVTDYRVAKRSLPAAVVKDALGDQFVHHEVAPTPSATPTMAATRAMAVVPGMS